ncbi:MAG: class I SAM-dependent methyltransferase [Salibacteraceae bacterium]
MSETKELEIEDWNIGADQENIREGAIELRARVAENMYVKLYETPEKAGAQVKNDRTFWRWQCLKKFEKIIGRPLSGHVVEVGAGTGWCSAKLSQLPEVQQVICMDYDRYSVASLVPIVLRNLDAQLDKIRLAVGSYNKMRLKDASQDYIVSIGAIHHSENLHATFAEAYRVLKPGGFLLAVEHCHPNSYTIREQIADNTKEIGTKRAQNLYGDQSYNVKVEDNSDHNYRIAEFESAAYGAGMDILPYIFSEDGEEADDTIFERPQPYRGYSNRVFQPYFAKFPVKPVYDNLFIVCQKPDPSSSENVFQHINSEEVKIKVKRSFLQKVLWRIMAKL